MNGKTELDISAEAYRQLLDHCRYEVPHEAIGMLSGITAMAVHRVTPLPNLVGQGGFFVHPRDQFLALRRLRDDGCLLVATYHSHPFGAPELSALDIRLLARWRCAHLVVVPAARTEPDRVAAYWIESTGPRRIEFRISPDLRGIVCAAETEGA